MEGRISGKQPAYDWVNTASGKLIVMLGSATNVLENVLNQFFARWNLSETKFNALLLLYKKEEMPLWELGEEMLVSRANITGLMDRLERDGLVTREVNQSDRRSLTARITVKARGMMDEVIPELKQFNEVLMKGLNGQEKIMLISLLEKLQNGVTEG